MILTNGKILFQAIPKNEFARSLEINNKEPLDSDYYIRQVADDLPQFKDHIGKKAYFRQHYYQLGVSTPEQIKNKEYLFIIDHSDIWGIE